MTSSADACRSAAYDPDPLEGLIAARLALLVERALDAKIREAVRQELARGAAGPAAPDKREWMTQPAAAQLAGCSVSTIRAWQAAGKLSKGERGRVKAAELRGLLAGRQAAPQAGVLDMKVAKIAASLKGDR